jgi:plasmid stabilization system protein ParE
LKVVLHPAAELDLEAAAAFYERQGSPALAARFIKEFWHAASLLLEQPDIGAPRNRGRRSFGLRVFPYSVVYEPTPDGITVLVVRHHRRHPSVGARR